MVGIKFLVIDSRDRSSYNIGTVMTRSLVPNVDSIGLNEQELYTLYLTARNDEGMKGIGESLDKANFGGHILSLDTAVSALKTSLKY